MGRRACLVLLTLGPMLVIGAGGPLHAQTVEDRKATRGNRYGLAVGAALSASPLGEIAERHGIFGVPGRQFEVRFFARTPANDEWSVAVLRDDYHIGRRVDRTTAEAFDYESTSVVVGYRTTSGGRRTRPVYGLDAGWVRYSTAANAISYYTGEPYASRATGNAVLLGASAGYAIPGESVVTLPRIRVEMNFPDFGGGDGYSPLHPETDLGLKASLGIVLRLQDLF